MTIITTYTCDKCGHKQINNDQMWEIGISLRHSGNPPTLKPKQLWCRTCVEKIGLLVPSPPLASAPAPALTLEDIVRDIIQQEIEQ